jgi:hypothetical protein
MGRQRAERERDGSCGEQEREGGGGEEMERRERG